MEFERTRLKTQKELRDKLAKNLDSAIIKDVNERIQNEELGLVDNKWKIDYKVTLFEAENLNFMR